MNLSFDVQSREKKEELNRDTDLDTVPQCVWALALPTFLAPFVKFTKKIPEKRILLSEAAVPDAFRNVRVDPNDAHMFMLHSRRAGSNRLV